ncbi:transposase, partial [Pseudanabaena sp. FACHB-1998]|uniref:transposase n=1 Tax=Pseudanabaena sp. FACHB-1998 TaxID=2692858 RepID=UPI001A7ED367
NSSSNSLRIFIGFCVSYCVARLSLCIHPRLYTFHFTLSPKEWVIIDNATFHHGGRIRELIEAAGCKLVYLPAYSPDLNRIEKCWAWLKHRIRKLLRNSDNLRDAMESVLAASAS